MSSASLAADVEKALADKIDQGQYTFDEAISIAREILFITPQTLNGMTPRSN